MSESVATTPQEKEAKSDLPRADSRKKLVDDVRRNRFKDRAKDLERGVSTPALLSGGTTAPPKAPLPLNEGEVVTVGQGMGHQFEKKSFFQLTYCHYCAELLWGIKGQGFRCQGNAFMHRNTGLPLLYCKVWRCV